MVARRGFVVHPADWFPSKSDNTDAIPELYSPWIAWDEGADEPTVNAGASRITHAALRELRRTNPAESRTVLQECFKQLNASGRAGLMKVMADNLTAEDAEFLAELADDRSASIRDQAQRYLARLGQAGDSSAASGLAPFFRITDSGSTRKRPVVKALALKTSQSVGLRAELFERVAFPQLANALGLPPAELIAAWTPTADNDRAIGDRGDREFIKLVARTGSDSQAETLALKLIGRKSTRPLAVPLLDRLAPAVVAKVALANRRAETEVIVTIANANDRDVIVHGKPGELVPDKRFLDHLDDPAVSRDAPQTRRLGALGTMMTPTAAAEALAALTARGLPRSIPALATLVLNAELGR
jgi:hypothetical protein